VAIRVLAVVVDHKATEEQRDALTYDLQDRGLSFWHHMVPLWLISDPSRTFTTAALRSHVKSFMPGVSVMVLRVNPTEWSAFAPKSGHQWLDDNLPREQADPSGRTLAE
jgi:hypothetical protein